jgi:hypothetical protein
MALSKTFEFAAKEQLAIEGETIELRDLVISESTYIRVESLRGNKSQVTVRVSLKTDKFIVFKEYDFEPNMNESNFIKQAYAHLKTLPEFAGATDC